MLQSLAYVTVLVPSYDEGSSFSAMSWALRFLKTSPFHPTSAGSSSAHRLAQARR
jgi:hypothetical protein